MKKIFLVLILLNFRIIFTADDAKFNEESKINLIDNLNFFSLVSNDNVEEVRKILTSEKVDINFINPFSGRTALMVASSQNDIEMVKQLLIFGAKVNKKNFKDGMTALMYAVQERHIGIVQLLLDADASIDLKNNQGQSALELASGNDEIEKLLNLYNKKKECVIE